MEEIYNSTTSDEEHAGKVNAMISMIGRQDEYYAKKIAEKNAKSYPDWNDVNGNIYDFIPWVRAKSLSMNSDDGQQFIHEQFVRSTFHFKNEFFISGLDLVDKMLFSYIVNHIENLNVLYLRAIYNQQEFRVFEVSGILNIFRSIMKESTNMELKKFVDDKIKNSINTYPSYPGSERALQMIRDQKIYLNQNGFNMNEYIKKEDNNSDSAEPEKLW